MNEYLEKAKKLIDENKPAVVIVAVCVLALAVYVLA